MDRRQIINHRQITWLICTLISAGGLLMVQRELLRIATVDAWFCYLPAIGYALLVVVVLRRLAVSHPGKHIFEITTVLCGSWGGRIVNALLLFHIWAMLVRNISALSGFIKTTMLPNTPHEIIILCFIAVIMYFGGTSVEVSARVNDILFPMFFLAILSLPIVLANEFSFERIQPVLVNPAVNLAMASLINAGWFGDIFIAGVFMDAFARPGQFAASLRHSVILAGFLLTLLTSTIVGVMNSNLAAKTIYPSYTLVRQIHISDFLDRVDPFVLSVWVPVTMIKYSVLFLAFLIGVHSFSRTKSRDYRYLARPVGWFLMFTTIFAFRNIMETFEFGNYGTILFVAAIQLPILLLLWSLDRWKTRRSGGPAAESPAADAAELHRLLSRRRRSTHLLLLGCAAMIAFGLMLGYRHAWAGIAAAVGFGVCLLGAVFTSRSEMSVFTNHNPSRENKKGSSPAPSPGSAS